MNESPLVKSLKEAVNQFKEFKELNPERAHLDRLRNATDEEVMKHVKEHQRLLAQAEDLNKIKKKKQAEDDKRRMAEEMNS